MIKIEELRQKRKELGLYQRQVAEALDITTAYVTSIETKNRTPTTLVLWAYYGFLLDYEKKAKKSEKSC